MDDARASKPNHDDGRQRRLVVVPIHEVMTALRDDRYLDRRSAAAYLDVSLRTLESYTDLRRYRIRKKLLYRKSELDQWVERHAERGPVDRTGLKSTRANRLEEIKQAALEATK
jgi:hypothetical protein